MDTLRLCSLEAAVAKLAVCVEDGCPFWEPGDTAAGERCAFEELELAKDAPLAAWLLELRERLASTGSRAGAAAARSLIRPLLDESAG